MRREKIKGGGAREGGPHDGKRTKGVLAKKGRAGKTRLNQEGSTERVGRVGYGEGRYAAEIREEAEGNKGGVEANNRQKFLYALYTGDRSLGV